MRKKHAADSPELREECQRLRGSYPFLGKLIDHNVPLTRENYIALNWGGKTPEPFTWEMEEQIPEPFRRPNPDDD